MIQITIRAYSPASTCGASLVVYPGWYVTSTARTFGLTMLVLNPKGLPGLLEKLPQTLPAEDIKLASYHLSRYARTKR